MSGPTQSRESLLAELREVQGGIDKAYWTYTRTARGKPPPLTVPHLYRRRSEIMQALGRPGKGPALARLQAAEIELALAQESLLEAHGWARTGHKGMLLAWESPCSCRRRMCRQEAVLWVVEGRHEECGA